MQTHYSFWMYVQRSEKRESVTLPLRAIKPKYTLLRSFCVVWHSRAAIVANSRQTRTQDYDRSTIHQM
jgi:hypothetical protein